MAACGVCGSTIDRDGYVFDKRDINDDGKYDVILNARVVCCPYGVDVNLPDFDSIFIMLEPGRSRPQLFGYDDIIHEGLRTEVVHAGWTIEYYSWSDPGFGFIRYQPSTNAFGSYSNLFFAVKDFQPDGIHMAWIQLAREAAHPMYDWKIVAHAWNPEPGAPMRVGYPASPQPRLEVMDDWIRVDWASKYFPGWSVDVTDSLDPPVKWTRVPAGAGPPVEIPATNSPLFLRIAQ